MNKYLEKAAKLTDVQKFHRLIFTGLGVGAGTGAVVGYRTDEKTVGGRKQKLSKFERLGNAASTSLAGAYFGGVGAGLLAPRNWKNAHTEESARRFRRFRERYQQYRGGGSAGNTYTSRTIHDIHKDLGVPSGFKTKSEATRHFRKERSRLHPDKHGGSHEPSAKLNRAWDEFTAHPQGFTKLANAYLLKIAGL